MIRGLFALLMSLLVLSPPMVWAQGLLINGSRTIAGTLNAANTTGTATAYLMNLDPPITAYVVNQCFTFRVHTTNTGAATLNVNGVAIKPLKKYVGTFQQDLVAGDMTSGQIVLACYDGTVMQVVGAGFAGSGGTGGALGYTAENVANKAVAPGLGTSDTAYPSQNAVKTYVDTGLGGKQGTLGFTPENAANKSNVAALGTSTTAYPTQGAVKTYVDTGLAGKQPTLGFTPEDYLNKSPTPTLGASDVLYPTQNAVKTYVDTSLACIGVGLGFTPEDVANKAPSSLLGASDTLYPTQNAVKTYVDTGLGGKQGTLGFTPENAANKSTTTTLGTSNALYPTQNAVKTYVDAGLASLGTGLGYTPENVANKATSTALGTSDTAYPSQNAVKTYVDTGLGGKQATLGFTPENTTNKSTSAGLGTSNTLYPTQGAVKGYVDTGLGGKQATLGFTPENVANKATSTALGTSNTLYPTQGAVKSYVDAAVSGIAPPTGGEARNASAYGVVCDGTTMTSAALQTALDTIPVGTRLILPGGNCMLNSSLTISRSIALHGAGMDHTYLRQTVTNIPVLTITSLNVHVAGFTAMHNTSPVLGGDGIRVRAPDGGSLQGVWIYDVSASWNWRGFVLGCMSYGIAQQVVAQKNNSHGFEFVYENTPGCGVDQWDLSHPSAILNKGAGFIGVNSTYAFGLGPFIWNATSFGNVEGGYVFIGSAGHPINDIRLHNVLSSADNVSGIYLDTHGGSHLILNPWIEYAGSLAGFPVGFDNTTSVASNTGHCLGVTNNNGATTITGGLYWNCAWSGVALFAPYATLVGGSSLGNGQALHTNLANRAGVAIGASGVHLSGHSFTFPGTTTLNYIHLSGVLDNIAIGMNTYSNDLSPQNFLANQASIPAARLPALVAGLSVHTNTAASPALQLYDATQGTAPLKLLRVTGGHLQILNATGSALIHDLSDEGTPAWPARRGQATIVDANVFVHVTLTPAEPNVAYYVQATPVTSGGVPPQASYTITGINKDAAGFDLLVSTAPGAGKSVTFDWFVHR